MITNDYCVKCGKQLNQLHILVGQMGNFCSNTCVEKYKTSFQKKQEMMAYQALCRLIGAVNRSLVSTPRQQDIEYIKEFEASVLNQKDWLKKMSELGK